MLNAPPPPYPAKPASIEEMPANLPEVQNFGILLKPLQPEEKKAPQQTNFGLNLQKINVGRKYSLNGTEVSQAVAEAAVLADDSDRYSLTFVGMAVPTLPEAVRSKVHTQIYKPEEWEVKQFALKSGVTLRKPQSGRVGTEILQASTFDTNAVLAAISGQPVKPVDPPKVLTFTEQDLTSDAKAKLIGSGIGGFTLSVIPTQPAKPMAKVEAAPAPSPAKKPVAVNAQGIPTEPAPPGKRWVKPGLLNEPGEWTLEDEQPLVRQVLPILSSSIFRFQCVNGVCR
jgi:hypothetical protein